MNPLKTAPLVSIGVPVYNGEKYLVECLESILHQTYENWECVISNNASTDRTPEIAADYVKKDNRFRLVHTDTLRPITENWNFCYANISQGSAYFKILPADDWLFPDYVSEMIGLMESSPGIGLCSCYCLADTQVGSGGLDYYEGNRFRGKEILVRQLKRNIDVTSSVTSVFYRTQSLRNYRHHPEIFQDGAFHIDTFLSFEILVNSDLGFVFQVLCYIRRHEESISSTVSSQKNTRIYFWEYALFRYKSMEPTLEAEYRKVRIRYAYFFLKSRLLSRDKILQWHRERLERPIKFWEYLMAFLRRIYFNRIP